MRKRREKDKCGYATYEVTCVISRRSILLAIGVRRDAAKCFADACVLREERMCREAAKCGRARVHKVKCDTILRRCSGGLRCK